MKDLIKRLNDKATIEEIENEIFEKGNAHGGFAHSICDTLCDAEGFDLMDESSEGWEDLTPHWMYSKKPLKKTEAIWQICDMEDGEWKDVCWCVETIDNTTYRYRYNCKTKEYEQVSENILAENKGEVDDLLSEACDGLWGHEADEHCLELATAIATFLRKHSLSKGTKQHVGSVLDAWSQQVGVDIDNPTGVQVYRNDWQKEGWRKPRVHRRERQDDGNTPPLPHASEYRGYRFQKIHKDLQKDIEEDQGKDFPTIQEQVKSLGKAMKKAGKAIRDGQQVLASEEQLQERKDVCATCEFFNADKNRCKQCGCALQYKLKTATESCPLDRWVAITGE